MDAAFIQPSLSQAAFIKLADAQRLPSFSFGRAIVQAGGLLSYAASQRDIAQRVAYMVDRILRGDKPAQMPVEQPASFELSINLRSARALGLAVPQSLLLRATELIE